MSAARIALLRSVNVSGTAKLPMADLRTLATTMGLVEPKTLLQSGNLVFRSDAETASLEPKLEAAITERFGFPATCFVRDAAEWTAMIAANPFPDEAANDPSHLLVYVLKTVPDAPAVEALQAVIRGREIVRTHGRHAYVTYPDGIGESKLTVKVVEAKLGPATGRNWNTVLKLAELAKS